jgi:ubiquinone/menaquinone biosynthesis C-methylase UbiE
MEDKELRSRSFDQAVDLYERARPSYPAIAVRWMVPAGARQVVDLAAGTGKLTRVLVRWGFETTAVEPLDGMRAELSRQLPGVTALAGTAEAIPLPDASADAVLVGQAWHWFDEDAAVAEIARVLRPGGAIGLVWNDQDDSVPWIRELRVLLGEVKAAEQYGQRPDDDDDEWVPPLSADFGAPVRADFPNSQRLDLPTLLDNLASRSYLITLPAAERAALLAAVADLLRTHPDTAGRDTFDLPYLTRCWRAFRE